MIGIDLQGDTRALRAVIDRVMNMPSRRANLIARLIKSGVEKNYHDLAWGGSIPLADGSSLQWSRVRSRMTIAIRQSRGLGALFPILTLTGKLGAGISAGGTSTSNGQTFTYNPAASVRALIQAHQYGLQPLPSRSSRSIFASKQERRLPPRPIMFWSSEMARQVTALATAEVQGGNT